MKKFLIRLTAIVLTVFSAFSFFGCKKEDANQLAIFLPDGAPALAFAQLMHEKNDLGKNATYTVVPSSTIQQYVANEKASVLLLPVNLATKLCGTGEKYKMLSVNTHGNLFLVGANPIDELSSLQGKTIAVVNLKNVPGLTLKAILKKANINYTENENDFNSSNVLLKNVDNGSAGAGLIKANQADYALLPQPAVSSVTSSPSLSLSVALNLQQVFDDKNNGYPQAVLVAKNHLANDKIFVDKLLDALTNSASWVLSNAQSAVSAISENMLDGTATTLVASALTTSAIEGCNIFVTPSQQAKSQVIDYMTRINEVSDSSFGLPSDNFFI